MSTDTFRQTYRTLSEAEKAALDELKSQAQALHDLFDGIPMGREAALAKTKLEEAVMWAVKGITG